MPVLNELSTNIKAVCAFVSVLTLFVTSRLYSPNVAFTAKPITVSAIFKPLFFFISSPPILYNIELKYLPKQQHKYNNEQDDRQIHAQRYAKGKRKDTQIDSEWRINSHGSAKR